MLEILETINAAVRDALANNLDLLSEHELIERADALLRTLPVAGGAQPTAALLLRRYRGALQKELCDGRRPRALPGAVDVSEGFSVETAALLALAIRADGVARLCEMPV